MNNKIVFIYMVFLMTGVVVFNGVVSQAAVIQVTTTQDNVPGSLRAAVTMANTNNQDNTIYIPAGTYILSGAAGDDANTGGDLDIDTGQKLTIAGVGPEITIIDGNLVDRVFHILKGTVSISGVTIQNGAAPDGDESKITPAEEGGGIYNHGTLTLSGCSIKSNSAGDWALVYSHSSQCSGGGIISDGKLTLIHCVVSDNRAGHGGISELCSKSGGSGGGIYSSGTLDLQSCTISNNESGGKAAGGGIFNSGEANITNCTINDNYTGGGSHGGGVYNRGSATLTGCTLSNNTTGGGYGEDTDCYGVSAGCGGGICNNGTLILTRCLIRNNRTGDGQEYYALPGGYGGGICHFGKEATLTNCTISNNRTGDGKLGGGGRGGGICGNGLTLIDCTICYNSTGEGNIIDPEYGSGGGSGGGISGSGFSIKNTIIAHNQVALFGKGPDVHGSLESLGYNLIEDIGDCTISGILTGNITGVDPLLAPLADNGGPTQTHALLPNSPAIDAGNSPGITEDQRGFTRPVDILAIPNAGDGSDIGAYEFDTSNTIYTVSGRITCGGTGLPGVLVTFSNSTGNTVTDDSGYYRHFVMSRWSGTATPWKEGYTFIPSYKAYFCVTASLANQDYTAAAIPPQISLNRTQLYFGVYIRGNKTDPQSFSIANSVGGVLNWTAMDNVQWMNCTPNSGDNTGSVMVSVDVSGLSAGTYTGVITIEAPNASNSPQYIKVELNVYKPGSLNLPFGAFETPLDDAAVMSSIPVTGWALDNIGIESVKIYRDPVVDEGSELIYIGDAVMVEGARPDIEAAYPGYPNNYKAGWGYMLLTYGLPNRGNGTFTLYANAADKEGNVFTLGKKTIHCDNAHAVKPFGAIDTPTQGGTASGSAYVNSGWALTPLPCLILYDGSTIIVWVDGVPVGHAYYNIRRVDIADLFPEYYNRDGAGGRFWLDTTRYENGIHTIAWSVTDFCGNTDGIGSRYFTVQNLAGSAVQEKGVTENRQENALRAIKSFDQTFLKVWPPAGPPEALFLQKGFNPESEPAILYPDENGSYTVESKELERVVIYLDDLETQSDPGEYCGYLVNGDQVKPLPIGSTLDAARGIFYWQPGPGFLGVYELVFITGTENGEMKRTSVTIKINPYFTKKGGNHE